MRHCPYTCVQTHLQADHPNLSLERQECLSVFRSPLKAATKVCRYILNGRVDSFIQLISSHSLSFFFSPFDEQAVSVIHLLSSSPKSLSICPPSFRLSPCPIHSHTFSVWPLATPAAKAMTDTSVKKKKGERWKEAGLQMHIHPVPMQSSATPSWCFKTRLSWGRQAGNRFKARRKERDKWGKNKKFRFKLAEQPKGSSRTKN